MRAEIRSQDRERRGDLPPALQRLRRDGGNGVADEIDRQRSAMRAAVALLVAGEGAQTRIR